jgi:hypothetical protein
MFSALLAAMLTSRRNVAYRAIWWKGNRTADGNIFLHWARNYFLNTLTHSNRIIIDTSFLPFIVDLRHLNMHLTCNIRTVTCAETICAPLGTAVALVIRNRHLYSKICSTWQSSSDYNNPGPGPQTKSQTQTSKLVNLVTDRGGP